MLRYWLLSLGLCGFFLACDGDADSVDGGLDASVDAGPVADPWSVYPAEELGAPRGWHLRRGIIHIHSPYSHDACDDEPFTDGLRNEVCFEDLRRALCETRQDYAFLTDHDDLFAEYEYPDVILFAEGDVLIERGGLPVANRMQCEDGHEVIVSAGTETGMMPIGLERHVAETVDERKAIYGDVSAEAIAQMQAVGALVFLQHTEGWSVEQVLELPIDGIEIYNTHQNLMDNMMGVFEMLARLDDDPTQLPVIELSLLPIFQENERDLERWSYACLQRPMPGILATDAHRNAFPNPSPDGERLDSFRRLTHWFSNYLLLDTAAPDDRDLKEAIGRGRMYGAFDLLGYPEGFDFHALVDGQVHEMGALIQAGQAELIVSMPRVHQMDPGATPPQLVARILKAAPEGVWEEVATGDGDLQVTVGPGAYRAEVRMVPLHWRAYMGESADEWLVRDYPWIYANPIYVGLHSP